MANYKNGKLGDITDICKALGDGNRARIVMALSGGELCVCRLIGLLDLAPSTVSKHLSILKQAGLIESRKNGRWVYYKLAEDHLQPATRTALAWLRQSLAKDKTIAEDKRKLKQITREAPEELCQRIKKK
jgi:DNA-binding transcriptional ArsR family regulator